MRVLHLPYNIASQISITVQGLRGIGVEARGLVLNNVDIQDGGGIENHVISRPFWKNPYRTGRQACGWLSAFHAAVSWADVVHWHYTLSPIPFNRDLAYIARLNKPRLVEFWGTEIRDPERACTDNPYLKNLVAEGNAYVISSRSSKRVQKAFSRAGFACLIPGPELFDYLVPGFFPDAVRTEAAVDVKGIDPVFPDPGNKKPVVAHMPSRPKVKGTEFVMEAVESLSHELDFEFRLIQNVPHREALDMVRSCDIMLDQFIIGSYGTAALEAMALGKPVFCYIKPSLLPRMPAECPMVNANPDDLRDRLKGMIQNGPLRHETGRKSRLYAEKHHDAGVVARQLAGIYRRTMEKAPSP
jgi:glycosyltransferase involved in cell wall biosynthesis